MRIWERGCVQTLLLEEEDGGGGEGAHVVCLEKEFRGFVAYRVAVWQVSAGKGKDSWRGG